ncbi:acetate--CoA ligase family protein [Caenimonas soli]|uniref:acetate--CoA ligase family protein n=1 Tax=Caenimonas soli TaxID=2735555 RepID=UPI0015567374|nr:acetate--CoA ligase family protein [Caenimonas soli]NPC58470.1 acetate--CoA ligase family protein [Caenimonas soli]
MTENIDAFTNPASVAVIGASDNPNKVGGRPLHYMKKFGFRGNIFPINPTRAEVQGLKAYPNVAAIRVVPDAVVIAVGGEQTLAHVRECAALGVKAGVIMSSGFGELGDEGRLRERELVEVARAGGMRLMGPNCQGPANFANGAVLNFSTMFVETQALDGPIAIVSQSGIASVIPYHLLRREGFGVRYVVATGNDADVGACAMTLSVARDPAIKLILVYLESLSDPDSLAKAAALARARGAYMVVLKSGESAKGAAAASSHTGALVGNDAAIDGFLARHGIWRARDMNELIRATALYLGDRPVGGGRLVAMSPSGAVAVMTADLAEREGLELASLAPATKSELSKILPEFGTPNNPLDTTAAILSDGSMWARAMHALASDPQADSLMVSMSVAGPGYDVHSVAKEAAALANSSDKPVLLSAPQERVRDVFSAHGIPAFVTEADAVSALAQYTAHQSMRDVSPATGKRQRLSYPGAGLLDEHESLALLSNAGVPVVRQRICTTPEEAQAAFNELNVQRVVVKGCAASVPHKSEHGLVRLGLTSSAEVATAAAQCIDKLVSLGVVNPQVIVAEMVRGVHELALGVTVDPRVGAVVMVGDGGTLIELRKDAVSLLAPFTVEQAKQACAKLRIAPLFYGYRDSPALDLDAFAEAAVALGNFAANAVNLRSVDVNPVIAMPKGQGVFAVDAVVELQEVTE